MVLYLGPHLVSLRVLHGAQETKPGKDARHPPTHTHTHVSASSAFLPLASSFPALAKQHNKWKHKIGSFNYYNRLIDMNVCNEGFNFPPVFIGLSDTESEVIYFCLADERDLHTVSHCYFI